LVSEDGPGTSFDRGYRYDGIGNRVRTAVNTTNTTTATGADLGTYFASSGGAAGANPVNQYGQVALPGQAPVAVVHDLDGNMTSGPLPTAPGSVSHFSWDAENRLTQVAVGGGGGTVSYRYDPFGRRIARILGNITELTLYDGWNPVAEYANTPQSPAISLKRTFVWGLDVSGSLQGAGGVGGLLAIREAAGNGSSKAGQAIFPAYDGNGNIIRLTDSNGATVASYAYDGFGNRINPAASDIDGSGYANENRYGFSTKPRDPLTGLLYYGYRWYDPATGRWASRDPMNEIGRQILHSAGLYFSAIDEINQYSAFLNRSIYSLDLFGLGFLGRLGNALAGAVGGAISGAITGAIAGAAAGFILGPKGALAGLVAGAKIGAIAGAVGGAVAGFMHGEEFDPKGAFVSGLKTGAVVGAIAAMVSAPVVGPALAVATNNVGPGFIPSVPHRRVSAPLPAPTVRPPVPQSSSNCCPPTESGIPNTFSLGRIGTKDWKPPGVTTNRHGQLTNGKYTLDDAGMAPHTNGKLSTEKSQFFHRVNEKQLTLDAASYADKAGLWVGNRAKVVLDCPIGVHGRTGNPTNVINIYGTIENLVGKGKRGAEPDSNTPNERQEWVRTALCDGKPPDSLDPWPSGPPNLEGARRGFRGLGTRHQAIPQPILGADCPPATH
jgi:RHS repeat-associated protein